MRDSNDVTGLVDGVGKRIRAHRRAAGRTLEDIARLTGVSVSTLSRLESGHRRPTLDVLLPLSRIYGVSLDDLVGAAETEAPRAKPSHRGGATHIALSRRAAGLVAFKSIYPAKTSRAPIRQAVHPGYDRLYVLRGRLRLALGTREHVLEAGEAAEFDTRVPHGFASASMEPTEVLNLMNRTGRRVDIRDL